MPQQRHQALDRRVPRRQRQVASISRHQCSPSRSLARARPAPGRQDASRRSRKGAATEGGNATPAHLAGCVTARAAHNDRPGRPRARAPNQRNDSEATVGNTLAWMARHAVGAGTSCLPSRVSVTGRPRPGNRPQHSRKRCKIRCMQPSSASQPASQAQQPQVAVLDGVLERVTFCNPETGYTIARIAPDRGTGRGPVSASTELVTAVGPLLGAQIGESLRLRGRWTSHMKYGRQFDVHSYTTVLPATEQGVRRYLGSGLIRGIGPVMAERMVAHFGVDIMHVIDDEPEKLVEVPGLGPKRSARIKDAWAEQKAIKEVMIFLQGVGVSTSLAVKIYKKYGDESIDTVKQQPYKLAADIWGIGFKTADTIAASVGIARDSPERIKAGLAHTLSEAADAGHCYLPEHLLVAEAAKILAVPADLIAPLLGALAAEELAVRDQVPVPGAAAAAPVQAVYLPPFYHSERSLASSLRRLLSTGADSLQAFQTVDWDRDIGWLKKKTGADLAPEQADAVKQALTRKVAVLTGGPGCGKSFTVRSVVELARARNAKVVLAAPTGRAAKRLAELTGHEAATIHRLLKLQPGGDPEYDADHPLDADLVVIVLANKLVTAVPPGAPLLLVGDVDQLPSVG